MASAFGGIDKDGADGQAHARVRVPHHRLFTAANLRSAW